MFYKQFLIITDLLNPEFVENFDYWLATLPRNNQKNITASVVSSRLEVKYSLAEAILKFAEKQGILEKYYLIRCPECDQSLGAITKDEIAEVLINSMFCEECEDDRRISVDDIYTAYKVIAWPDMTEDELKRAIENKLDHGGVTEVNFTIADSLSNDTTTLYEAFYNPSESAYKKFRQLRKQLDLNYGDDTTAKGKALETLILEIVKQIKHVRCTNDVKTKTNQFDCTAICGVKSINLTVFTYLAPYFIIECKNEPESKPNNTYCNKLLSIMDTNEAQIGMIFGRIDATKTCFIISREHYLRHINSKKNQIILLCSDKDLDYLIDKKVNLLKYLEFKMLQVTTNSPNSKFEMFTEA